MTDNEADVATPPAAPTISQSPQIDWGSWTAQLLIHETSILVAVADTGIEMALAAVPFGAVIEKFIAIKVVNQYIEQGLVALEGVIEGQTLSLPSGSAVYAVVTNLINKNEPKLVQFLGPKIDELIKAGLAKLKIHV